MTRAWAAAIRAFGGIPTSKPALQDQKRNPRTSSTRATLDEKNSIASNTAYPQCKRRAVLQDVTNVCCENSYTNFMNATRRQLKNVKQAKKVQAKALKVALVDAVKNPPTQAVPRKKLAQDTIKTKVGPEEFNCSKSVQDNILSQFSTQYQKGA